MVYNECCQKENKAYWQQLCVNRTKNNSNFTVEKMIKINKQELSEDNIFYPWQPNLNSNCELVCLKSKITVFIYG